MLQTLAQPMPPTPQGLCQEVPEVNTKHPRPGQAISLSHPLAGPFPPFQGKRGMWGRSLPGLQEVAGSGYPGDVFLFTEMPQWAGWEEDSCSASHQGQSESKAINCVTILYMVELRASWDLA